MKIKKILQHNKWLLLAIILLFGITGILQLTATNITAPLYSQQEARRWENGVDHYAQVSAFFDAAKALSTDGVAEIENGMLSKLSEDGYLQSDHSQKTWLDAYSGESRQNVVYKDANVSVTVTGIGGDFFQFHPIPLKSGSYITANDINGDRVVIDRYVAWELYGSNDVVGMKLYIGDRTYTVAGVTDVPENALYRNAYGENHRIYINYNELKAIDERAVITCFEAVLPNPITNYAYNVLASACGISEDSQEESRKSVFLFGDTELVENSSRFGLGNMVKLLQTARYRVARTNGVGYPFWENIARMKETTVLTIFKVQAALCLLALVLLVIVIIRARRIIGTIDLSPVLNRIREAMRVRAEKRSKEKADRDSKEKTDMDGKEQTGKVSKGKDDKDSKEQTDTDSKETDNIEEYDTEEHNMEEQFQSAVRTKAKKKRPKKRRKNYIDEEEMISDDYE